MYLQKNYKSSNAFSQSLIWNIYYGKKGVKWDINYSFSEKTTKIIAPEPSLCENVTGEV